MKGNHYRSVIVVFTGTVCVVSVLYFFPAFMLLDYLSRFHILYNYSGMRSKLTYPNSPSPAMERGWG